MRESAPELGTNWAQIRPGPSFDHLIRPLQERGRDREVEGLRGLEVDHQHELRAGYLAGELHATEDVVVGDVTGHAGVKHVADAEVHDRLGGRAGVDAAQEYRGRILSLRARFLLSQVVLRCLLSHSEPLITLLHELDDLVRRQLVTLRLGQCGGPGNPARERGANEGDRAGYARGFEECAAAETLRIGHVDSPRSSLVWSRFTVAWRPKITPWRPGVST